MPIYEVTGNFACQDAEYSDTVSVLVQREDEPTPEQAQGILWSRAVDAVRVAKGDVYEIEFVCTEVTLKSRTNIGCTGCGQPDTAKERMLLKAEYHDGFTERLLSWKLSVRDGQAILEASWFRPEPQTRDFRIKFRMSLEPLNSYLPALRMLNSDYQAPWEDQDRRILQFESAEGNLRREVYGIWFLMQDHPELAAFEEAFNWLEAEVFARLPLGLQAAPPDNKG